MSRLIDKLTKTDRAAFQPMGFRASRQAPAEPRMQLIARLELKNNIASDLIGVADALLLFSNKTLPPSKELKSIIEPLADIPWGISLQDATANKASSLIKAGCDFIVFPAATTVSAIQQDDDTGMIIEVESSIDDGLLRAINDLPVDAVMVADSLENDGPLVWHQLMIIQHVVNLLTKPIILPASPNTSESELKILWESGVDGVLIKIGSKDLETIKGLRSIIDRLPARSTQKKGKTEAILPHPGGTGAAEPEPEEDDEDWE